MYSHLKQQIEDRARLLHRYLSFVAGNEREWHRRISQDTHPDLHVLLVEHDMCVKMVKEFAQ